MEKGKIFIAPAVLLAGLLLFLGYAGGPGTPIDERLVRSALAISANPTFEWGAILLTYAGSAFVLVPLTFLFALILVLERRRWDALALLIMALGGRLLVEVIKLIVNRPRPVLEDYPVVVSSMSFPSGHSANTMTSFLAFALILVPARHRTAAVATAVLGSIAVGLTRPLLGVHWPSDVLGGWTLGILWILICMAFLRRDRTAA